MAAYLTIIYLTAISTNSTSYSNCYTTSCPNCCTASYSYNAAQNADTYPYHTLTTYCICTPATCPAYSYSYNTARNANTYPYNTSATCYIYTPASCTNRLYPPSSN